jgi:hypothetical protein
MNPDLAPVVLFVYNRPGHTVKTLDALSRNYLAPESRLFIFADGPKANSSETERLKIQEVRAIIHKTSCCGSITIVESKQNKGLSVSILNGVTEIIEKYGRVIVLEDDMVTSPWFLNFMNEALGMYEREDKVVCISGYVHPVPEPLPFSFFIRGSDCWGWATWKRAWDTFERDGKKSLAGIKRAGLTKAFEYDGTYPYMRMLREQISGKNDSWAIRWYASAFLAGQLMLYPGKSLLKNIGADGSGTHGGINSRWDTDAASNKPLLQRIEVIENSEAKAKMARYFKSLNLYHRDWLGLMKNKIRSYLMKS